ncbi:MAG: Uma2 family endonuclease [Deltaproteobacteria bacterium]|nr:Uma2 family endonuclease [Deltaproteobacteria bacterium]
MTVLDVDAPDISELVTEDDEPVDNIRSEKSQRILTAPLYDSWEGPTSQDGEERRKFLAAANVGLFSSVRTLPLVPDAFLSLDVEVDPEYLSREHRTYFFWEFGKPPDVVIEIVSNKKGGELTSKRSGYARMRVSYYVVWDPELILGSKELYAFRLTDGIYQPIAEPVFEVCGLRLVLWDGTFEGVTTRWLRWARLDATLIPTGKEARAAAEAQAAAARGEAAAAKGEAAAAKGEAAAAKGEAAAAKDEAAAANERSRRLADQLRALGVDPGEA